MGKNGQFAREILEAIRKNKAGSADGLNKLKLATAKRLGIEQMPSNPDILSRSKNPSRKETELLSIKPLRTLSGVAPVAIMTKPIKCPHGTCLYCPGGPGSAFGNVPQSYTGNEPATMRAINNNYDSYAQTMNRLSQYYSTGHSAEKIELIIMGGTFPSFPKKYREEFVAGAFGAANDFSEKFFTKGNFDREKFSRYIEAGKTRENTRAFSPEKEHKRNETAKIRVVAMCIETRPDYSNKRHIGSMLSLGATRVELGVQSIYNSVLKKVNRGHTTEETVKATRLLKDAGFKVTYHIMPGLPGSPMEKDIAMFRELFENPDYRPDGLKIYPCVVMPGTGLEKLYRKGEFSPLTTDEAAEIISEGKRFIPEYARVYRVQRDVPVKLGLGGIDKNNLRQIIGEKLGEKGIECRCIRCRESGLGANRGMRLGELSLHEHFYTASGGEEAFISFGDENGMLAGFCRLRKPRKPFRKEFTESTCVVRELHVFGKAAGLGKKTAGEQHRGYGKKLLERAEETAKEKFGADKILVISGVGAREYYGKKHGYSPEGAYMAKKIRKN